MIRPKSVQILKGLCALTAGALFLVKTASAQPVFNFPFNEGSGAAVSDTASGLTGRLGFTVGQDPAVDTVVLSDDSPSGLPGDRSITTQGTGFLSAADNTNNPVLAITNGPITMECWVNINPDYFGPTEGIGGYGNSYKMGMKGGWQVFTLFGKADITNSAYGPIPPGQWVHMAAAWNPGVGVTFWVNGSESFVANTNLAARPAANNYLGIGSEGLTNNLIASFDRFRIHHAVLTAAEIDSDPANPKPNYPSTIVAYNFNEASFPCTNSLAPSMPTIFSTDLNAAVFGPVWTKDTPTKSPSDSALFFDGAARRVTIPDPNLLIQTNSVNGDYTLEAWVKLPQGFVPTNRMVMMAYPAPQLGFSFSINNNRTLHTTFYKKKDVTSTALLPDDGKWHHVAAVHQDGKEVRFYIDKRLAATTAYTTGPGFNTGQPILTIGLEGSASTVFTGSLDRLRFSNQALTPDQFDAPPMPLITLSNQVLRAGTTTNVPFVIDNVSAFNGSVSVTATATNNTLLPPGSLALSGSGANQNLTIAPAVGQTGGAVLTISATDGAIATTANPFLKVVRPDAIVLWDFNSKLRDNNPNTGTLEPAWGTGTASSVGTATNSLNSNVAPTNSDPEPQDNSKWRFGFFPDQGTGNKTSGAEFRVSTLGYQNVSVSWDHYNSATGSKYWRLQYSTDGTTFNDFTVYTNPVEVVFAPTGASFASIPGANNNPNFAIRIVSEFESTATGAGADQYVATQAGATYGVNGTLWLDSVALYGDPYVPGSAPTRLSIINTGLGLAISWQADAAGTLESTDSLSSPNWQPVSQTPTVISGHKVVTVSNPTGTRFYRLHQ